MTGISSPSASRTLENSPLNHTESDITNVNSKITIGIVVGEHSGDTLGAGLITALKKSYPNAKFVGIGGPKMQAVGFHSLYPMEELSVMGIFEVLGRLRRLLKIRKSIANYFIEDKPAVFIGIDAPDFNLTLEEKLKNNDIKTIQYVSPSVWAWREKRIFKIERATHNVLSLLPFEKAFYDKHQVPCEFVGHPLADDIPLISDQAAARLALNLPADGKILALMPGSRGGELSKLVAPFLATAQKLLKDDPTLVFVAPMISEKRAEQFTQLHREICPELPVKIIKNQTQQVMAASDCLLMASGTVTLEAALVKRPMVVTYKFNTFSYYIFKRLVKLKWFSLPNLLANKSLVPELLQNEVTADNLVPLIKERLYQDQTSLNQAFNEIHQVLKCDASAQAAHAVIKTINA